MEIVVPPPTRLYAIFALRCSVPYFSHFSHASLCQRVSAKLCQSCVCLFSLPSCPTLVLCPVPVEPCAYSPSCCLTVLQCKTAVIQNCVCCALHNCLSDTLPVAVSLWCPHVSATMSYSWLLCVSHDCHSVQCLSYYDVVSHVCAILSNSCLTGILCPMTLSFCPTAVHVSLWCCVQCLCNSAQQLSYCDVVPHVSAILSNSCLSVMLCPVTVPFCPAPVSLWWWAQCLCHSVK